MTPRSFERVMFTSDAAGGPVRVELQCSLHHDFRGWRRTYGVHLRADGSTVPIGPWPPVIACDSQTVVTHWEHPARFLTLDRTSEPGPTITGPNQASALPGVPYWVRTDGVCRKVTVTR